MSPLASYVCDGCRRRSSARPTTSPTGRRLCAQCMATLLGAGVAAATDQDLPTTIATVGWLQRVRAARGKGPWPGEERR